MNIYQATDNLDDLLEGNDAFASHLVRGILFRNIRDAVAKLRDAIPGGHDEAVKTIRHVLDESTLDAGTLPVLTTLLEGVGYHLSLDVTATTDDIAVTASLHQNIVTVTNRWTRLPTRPFDMHDATPEAKRERDRREWFTCRQATIETVLRDAADRLPDKDDRAFIDAIRRLQYLPDTAVKKLAERDWVLYDESARTFQCGIVTVSLRRPVASVHHPKKPICDPYD